MRLNLCIDIDGTLTDAYYWLDMANEYFGTDIKPFQVTKYDIHEVLGVPKEAYLAFYERHGEEIHRKAELRDDVKEILWTLDQDHEITYVTARETKMKEVTEAWFHDNNLPEGQLYLLGSHYKVDKARELRCHIFIEDRYENAIQLASAGFEVLLIDCNYNQKPLVPGVTRVFNWGEVHNKIVEYNQNIEMIVEKAVDSCQTIEEYKNRTMDKSMKIA
ncbi:5' nucleotidase, NT5C type [Anaerosolibacter sp.]|uniref:5' nucleotidase, NT5C type n=1 Tax=Anaerosolibacter sp. TaxID=1872527 RepID=UPI0039EEAA9D